MNEDQPKDVEVKVIDMFNWQIPDCCKEGWESCPHVLKKQRPSKKNIAI